MFPRGGMMMMAAGARFLPSELSGVVGWWDSTDGARVSLSGSEVTAWQDKIQGVSLTGQGTNAANILRSSLNGEQVISFPGSNAFLGVSATPSDYPLTMSTDDAWIFAAVKLDATASTYAPSVAGFGGGDSMGITGPLNTTAPSPGYPQLTNSGAFNYWASSPYLQNAGAVLEAHFGGSVTAEMWVNGALATPGATATTPPNGSTSGAIEFGRRMGTSEYLTGLVGDVIIAKDISTSDRQKLEGYLAWKFGLQGSLPANHPYKSDRP